MAPLNLSHVGDNTNAVSDASVLIGRLLFVVQDIGPAAVAFSGGVDSAVVARAMHEVYPGEAVAVTAVSPSLAASDLADARTLAELIGIRHVEMKTSEFSRPEYAANAADRCFFCKDTLYTLATRQLQQLGVRCLVNGANIDDLGDHRPGMKAAAEHGVRSPLIEAKLNKQDVRTLANAWELPVAGKPASPCLSSRIAYGVAVTEQRVDRVEKAEVLLRNLLGRSDLRVRHEQNDVARLEVPLESLAQIAAEDIRGLIVSQLRELGFRRVTLDLEGFRSGSMNLDLPIVDLRQE